VEEELQARERELAEETRRGRGGPGVRGGGHARSSSSSSGSSSASASAASSRHSLTSEPSAESIVAAPTARGTARATRGRRERVVSAPPERAKQRLKSTRTSPVTHPATPVSADDSAAAGGRLSAARVDVVAARLRDELAEERCARDAVRAGAQTRSLQSST